MKKYYLIHSSNASLLIRVSGLIIFLVLSTTLNGQVLVPSWYERDYYDLVRMKNNMVDEPITYFPSIIHGYEVSDSLENWNIWANKFSLKNETMDTVVIINPSFHTSYSTNYSDVYNDGAVWEGRGFNGSMNFGFWARKGKIQITFYPVIFYAQNKDFYIPQVSSAKSQYSYPFERKIDWVLRFGDKSLTSFHPGQSEIKLLLKKFDFNFSTQSMVFGPAQVAPIIMSNNAGGIPHFSFGTSKPISTKVGRIEFRTFWGLMQESKYFDSNPDNDNRYFTSTVFGFEPTKIPGLSIGINRVMYREMFDGDFKPIDIFASLWKNIDDPDLPNDNYDQMASLLVRWRFKEYGFNTYIEWARNDFPGTITDLFENPERTRAVTMGIVKTFDLADKSVLRIVYEHTKLNKIKMSVATTGHPTYYVHSVVDNGYTNMGQIMGAYIGPGSNAHHIKLQHYTSNGRIGFNIDRVRFNDDYFISQFAGASIFPNDIRYTFGLDFLRFFGSFSVDTKLNYSYWRNWYYEADRDVHNITASLSVRYFLNNQKSN